MKRFRFKFDLHCKTSEYYKKPVNKGSFVYIYDVDNGYEAQTIYKVAYYDEETKRILVEVDPKKNLIDSKYIKGWDDYYYHIKLKDILEEGKLYWWVCLWQQASNSYVLNNE